MATNYHNDDEAAPLLADSNLNHDDEANGDLKLQSAPPRNSLVKERSLRLWRWLRNSVRMLALTTLLLGGLIALITFIARTTWSPLGYL